MIEFSCTYCGRRFRIAAESAGKKGTCPNCRRIVVVPESPTRLRAEDFAAGKPEPEPEDPKSPYDLTLLDVPGHVQEKQQSAAEEAPMEAYPEEFRDDVVKVARNRPDGTTLEQIAADFGIHPMTLSKWLRQAAIDDGDRPGTTTTESAELREARKRIRLLEQENEVLRRAAAYLGQASIPKG